MSEQPPSHCVGREEHKECVGRMDDRIKVLEKFMFTTAQNIAQSTEIQKQTTEMLHRHLLDSKEIVKGYEPLVEDIKEHLISDKAVQNSQLKVFTKRAMLITSSAAGVTMFVWLYKIYHALITMKGTIQ